MARLVGAPTIKQAKKNYYRTYIPVDEGKWLSRLDNVINLTWATLHLSPTIFGLIKGDLSKKETGKIGWEVAQVATLWTAHQIYQFGKYG